MNNITKGLQKFFRGKETFYALGENLYTEQELVIMDEERQKKDEQRGYSDRMAHCYDKWYRYNRSDNGAAYDRGVVRCVNEKHSKNGWKKMKASTSLNVRIERWCEMKKFKNFGYKQETIEVREISMGNLVHIICQALIAKDKKDMEIRIVDCYAGEVDVYNGMEDLLMQDFIFDWKVNAYQIECLHNNKTDKDFLKVIIADNVEGGEL